MGLSFIAFLITAALMKQSLAIPKSWAFWLILLGVISLAANLLATYSFQKAPNPGYTQAIISASAVVVLITSLFLLNAEFSWIKILGVLLTLVGIIILSVG